MTKSLLGLALALGSSILVSRVDAQASFSFQGKHLASDGLAGDQFGHGIGVSGDTVVIGAQNGDGLVADCGTAFVFVRSGTVWSEQAKLMADDGELGDTFGVDVAIDGDTVVVGSRFDDDNGSNSGAAYVFVRSGTTWTQEQKLTASDGAMDDAFGRRVAISGDTILVGAPGHDSAATDGGAAYVFVRSGTTWTEEQKLTAGDAAASDRFGIEVDVDGDKAVVAAQSGDGTAVDSGTVYVFDRSGTTWTQDSEIFAVDSATGDAFGRALSLSGDTLLIGAQGDDDSGAGSGSAYVFSDNNVTWVQQAKLNPADNQPGNAFGASVSVEGDLAVVGAQQGDGVQANSGSVYVYTRTNGVWTALGELFAGAGTGDSYGFACDVTNGALSIGSIGDDDNGSGAGAAYMYSLTFSYEVAATFVDVTALKSLDGYDASGGDVHSPGAVFTDLTNDGYPDLYVMRSGFANELYVNVDDLMGGRTFVQVPNNGDAGNTLDSQGAVAADYDNDGDLDIYLLNWRGDNVLYKNMWVEDSLPIPLTDPTQLRFEDVTASTDPTPGVADDQHGVGFATFDNTAMGLGDDKLHNSLTAAWADVNRDGFVDLYHGSHDGLAGNPFSAEDGELGERDTMYLNLGDGTFMDITMSPPWTVPSWEPITGFEDASGNCCDTNLANPQTPREFGCTNAATFADFDNDGWPDLMVTNKSGSTIDRDMLYLNLGLLPDGNWAGFTQVAYTLPLGNGGTVGFGTNTGTDMGVIAGDLDNDGDLDAYASLGSQLQTWCDGGEIDGGNVLWINQLSDTGTLSFDQDKDVVEAVWSWGVTFADYDNNGRLDVHAVTERDARSFLYLQTLAGEYIERTKDAGVDQCDTLPRSFGLPHADYDRDGWMDAFSVNVDSLFAGSAVQSSLFENNSDLDNPAHHYLSLRLVGNPLLPGPLRSSRDALGARVYVTADLDGDAMIEADETMIREVTSGSGNTATTSSLELHFGLGLATTAEVRVEWPSGRVTRANLAADQFLTLKEGKFAPLGHFIDARGPLGPPLTQK